MNKIYLGIISIFLLFFSSCTKTILDINTNPNSATYTTPQLAMPAALVNAASTLYGPLDLGMWMGYTANNNGAAPSQQTLTYQITSSYFSGVWSSYYLNISNFNNIDQLATQGKFPLYSAIAKLFMAYDFSCLVDIYNDVPYSDALLKNGNYTPTYDKASNVYDSCVALIDQAISILKQPATAASIVSNTDNTEIIMFKGSLPDLTQWMKFANSLKLRLLLNESNVASKANYIKTEVAQIDPTELMGIGDDALVDPPYQNVSGKMSPLAANFYTTPGNVAFAYGSNRLNSYALNFYNSTNDPRLSFFYDQTSSGDYVGNPLGTVSPVTASPLGAKILSSTAPAPIITAAEALFNQAEAIQLGWISGDAEQTYKNAVIASFQYTGQSTSAASAYLSQSNSNTNWDVATNKMQLIVTQKWAALNHIDLLAVWDDYRRTGYPNVSISVAQGHLQHIPYRFIYPQDEYSNNAANVAKEGTIDPQTDKIFWEN